LSAERGRYSRVSRRIWNDSNFRSLSQPKPCGASLFFRLLTGPELTSIPGLFQAWDSGLAQALGWSSKDFAKAFGEISAQGLAKADWSVGLVWLPKAIQHNEPESPNVVVGWRTPWSELPECSLKDEAHSSLLSWAEAKGEAWAKAFEKASGKARGASFDVAMIPRWASEALVAVHRSHFAPKASDLRTDEDWNQSCSKWVHGDWNNPRKRPKRPEPEAKADETGGFGAEAEWGAGA
jgi:hypothetical protein